MPELLCLTPGCPSPADDARRRRCRAHSRAIERTERRREGGRFYDLGRWRRTSRRKLTRDPLCEACLADGIETLATEVDHVRPVEAGGAPFDPANLRSLCGSCHAVKTARERATR